MTTAAGYRASSAIQRRHGTTFYLASLLLPADRRPHVHALYALARTADDLVDEPRAGIDAAVALDDYRTAFMAAVAGEPVDDPVLSAAADTVRRFDIALDCFDRFFASMRQDIDTSSYETWSEVLSYMDGSAAAIGDMLLPILGPTDPSRALEPARSLGLAFQLTNFLRDIGDDLDRGRQYVPQADLRRFGVTLTDRRVDDAFVGLMRFEIDRCRRLYAAARPGIGLLPRRCRIAIGTAHRTYGAILDEIERQGYDVFARRATVPSWKRVSLAAASAARLIR